MSRANLLKYKVAGLLARLSFRLDREAFNLCGIKPKWRVPQPQRPHSPSPQLEAAVIVIGNPVDGLEFYGPFADVIAASRWGHGAPWLQDTHLSREWWEAPLHAVHLEAPHA